MKVYRTTPLHFKTPEEIFTGIGAAESPGRWNLRDQRVIYCSSTIEASASERAYHSVRPKVEIYNKELMKKGNRITASYYEDIVTANFNIAEIEINDTAFLQLDTNETLTELMLKARIESKTLHECRTDKYEFAKPPFWTRHLSNFIFEEGFSGFVVSSARCHTGNTVVIFEDCITRVEPQVTQITTVSISALNKDTDTKIKKGALADLNRFMYASSLGNGYSQCLIL
jgi:hypothetical protein